jgi:hypothetical protein
MGLEASKGEKMKSKKITKAFIRYRREIGTPLQATKLGPGRLSSGLP